MVNVFCGGRFHASHVARRDASLVGRLRQTRDPQRRDVGEPAETAEGHGSWELDCSVVWLLYGRALCADDRAVRWPGQAARTLSQSNVAPS